MWGFKLRLFLIILLAFTLASALPAAEPLPSVPLPGLDVRLEKAMTDEQVATALPNLRFKQATTAGATEARWEATVSRGRYEYVLTLKFAARHLEGIRIVPRDVIETTLWFTNLTAALPATATHVVLKDEQNDTTREEWRTPGLRCVSLFEFNPLFGLLSSVYAFYFE